MLDIICENVIENKNVETKPETECELCGSPKKRSRTSSIVQFIFYFWSFEIGRNILRNQNIL